MWIGVFCSKKFIINMKKILSILTAVFLSTAAFSQTSFFTPTNYVGAFGTTDWTSGWANWTPQNTNYPATTQTISGEITANTTWTKNNVYLLSGFIYVKNGATLTIEPGTVIRGEKATKGSLIICRGAKIVAEGSASSPIVFTSNEAAGSRNYGDWGGIIILGKATINPTGGTAAIEGGVDNANGDGQYGGTDDNDNSGSLKYVRIEFPGIAFQPNSEINGLTMAGVGKSTTIEAIQVSYSGDDSYEWFGGTVNAKWLIAHRGWDDDFDTDFGYRGLVQFGVALRDSAVADQSGSNGFESDNDGTGSANSPFTSALFSNMTIIGPKVTASNPINSNFKRGAHIRRNTRESIYNSIITGYPVGLFLDGASTLTNLKNNDFQFENNILAGCTKNADTARTQVADPNFSILAWLGDSKRSDRTLTNSADVNLIDPFNYTNPNFLPNTGSPALTGASFANARLGGFNGISNVVNENESTIYPNPAEGSFQLNLVLNQNAAAQIVLANMQGVIVKNIYNGNMAAGQQTMEINTTDLASGYYMLIIHTASGLKTIPVAIAK